MRKLFFFFIFSVFVSLLASNLTAGIVVKEGDEDKVADFTENNVIEISQASVRPGLGKGAVVEYFGDAHCKSLLNQAKEAGFTSIESQGLVDVVLIEKRTLKGKGPEALSNFYIKLDAKRTERDAALNQRIKELEDKISKFTTPATASVSSTTGAVDNPAIAAKLAELDKLIGEYKTLLAAQKTAQSQQAQAGQGAILTSSTSSSEDPVAIAKEAREIAQEAKNTATDANNKVDALKASWEATLNEACGGDENLLEAIRQVDRKVQVVNAKIENQRETIFLLHNRDRKDNSKGEDFVKMMKERRDADKAKEKYKPIRQVDESVDIDKEVLPKEKAEEEKKPEGTKNISLRKPPRRGDSRENYSTRPGSCN